jgi:hypothetical protein
MMEGSGSVPISLTDPDPGDPKTIRIRSTDNLFPPSEIWGSVCAGGAGGVQLERAAGRDPRVPGGSLPAAGRLLPPTRHGAGSPGTGCSCAVTQKCVV